MSLSFNVLDQSWIPVIDLKGNKSTLGIRQVLFDAHNLKEISVSSPLEEYSLYRFLGLFLMDALRPARLSSIRSILRTGYFDKSKIEDYISLCQDEGVTFNLFDDERPFLQSKYDAQYDKGVKPVEVLDCTLPSGNNHTHFHHSKAPSISAQKAARLLLSTYWFCLAGAQGYPNNVYGYPPYFGVIKSNNLFESLVNTLLPIDIISLPFDTPPVLWRRTESVIPKREIGSTSWLEGMLFPARRILLNHDDNGQVVSVYLSQGEKFVNQQSWRDPYATYCVSKDSTFPLKPSKENPIWRNLTDILDIAGHHAPQIIQLYYQIHGEETTDYTLYGIENEQAKYLSVYRHDFKLPLKLSHPDLVQLLQNCISTSYQLLITINRALRISTLSGVISSSTTDRYNRDCENRFWKLCEEASVESVDIQTLYSRFCDDISKYAINSFDVSLSQINLRGTEFVLAEESRSLIYAKASTLKKEAYI